MAAYNRGEFLKDQENKGKPPANPMTDPAGMDQMMNMLKGNMAMMVPQTLIMGWINAFFSGFVISECAMLCDVVAVVAVVVVVIGTVLTALGA